MRFEVIPAPGMKYVIKDSLNGKFLRYSYNAPLYATEKKLRDEWQNVYAARGFAQKMQAAVTGKCTE